MQKNKILQFVWTNLIISANKTVKQSAKMTKIQKILVFFKKLLT